MVNKETHGRKIVVIIGAVVALIGITWIIWSRWPPPQLIADEQVFKTVDALFTALTARDDTRLDECESRLQSYHQAGKLSDAVAARLDAIMQLAHEGNWQPAAEKLYYFMLGQRGNASRTG